MSEWLHQTGYLSRPLRRSQPCNNPGRLRSRRERAWSHLGHKKAEWLERKSIRKRRGSHKHGAGYSGTCRSQQCFHGIADLQEAAFHNCHCLLIKLLKIPFTTQVTLHEGPQQEFLLNLVFSKRCCSLRNWYKLTQILKSSSLLIFTFILSF